MVPVVGRGDLPFATLHGVSLVDLASALLTRAGVDVIASDAFWSTMQEAARARRPLVLQDPLCPLTPATFVTTAVKTAHESGRPVVGVRPVTDTIKSMQDDLVGQTIDRGSLVSVASPIVLPPSVVEHLGEWPDLSDLAELVALLSSQFAFELVEAPSLGRHVEDESAVLLLEAFEEVEG